MSAASSSFPDDPTLAAERNRVNCYVPRELAAEYRDKVGRAGPSFSQLLRRGIVAELTDRGHRPTT